MNEIQIFKNDEFGEIRTITIDGEIYFVGTDVARALGYKSPRKAVRDHVDKEDMITVPFWNGIRGNPNRTVINESGFYSLVLVLASKKKT